MTRENAKRLFEHFKNIDNKEAVKAILKKYPDFEEKEEVKEIIEEEIIKPKRSKK